MKKMVFLILALLTVGIARSQFVVEKLWESTADIPAVGNAKQGTGHDGTIYIQDKGTSLIYAFQQVGSEVVRTNYATSDVGSGFDCDDAGNLIVRTGYFAAANPEGLKIYKKGETTPKSITFTLDAPGRADFTFATGDIFSSEGGYLFFYCNTQTTVSYVKIKNGGEGEEAVTTGVVGTGLEAGTSTTAVYAGDNSYVITHKRSAQWQKFENGKLTAATPPGAKITTLGASLFTIKDTYGDNKEIWAYNTGTRNYDSQFKVRNMTDEMDLGSLQNVNEQVFMIGDGSATSDAYANWLRCSKIDDKTYYIHQIHPGKGIALYKVYDKTPAPIINISGVDNNSLNFIDTEIGSKNEMLLTISGANLANQVVLESNNAAFKLSQAAIEPTDGAFEEMTVKVTFIPSTAGDQNGLITISSKGVTHEISVNGVGVEPAPAFPIIVEKLWESTENMIADADARQGAGYNGTIYTIDKTNKKAYTFTHNGNAVEKNLFIDAAQLNGTGIAVDDAGNIVYGTGFAGSNPSSVVIVKAGENTMKSVSFTLPKGSEANVGRTDFISAFGNIFSKEGGLVFFYSQNQLQVSYVKITNGGATDSDVTVGTITANNITKGGSGANIFKGTETSVVAHVRSNQLQLINNEETAQTFELPEIKTSTLGGCTFTVKDATGNNHEIWVYNTGTNNYDSRFKVYSKTDNIDLTDASAEKNSIFMIGDGSGLAKTSSSNWLTSSKVNDGTYYVHQYTPGVGIALYKVYDPAYVAPIPPTLSTEGVTEGSIDFGTMNIGEEKQVTFKISGDNLTSDIALSTSNEAFVVTPNSISPIEGAVTSTDITITLKPTTAGTITDVVNITSEGIHLEIVLTANINELVLDAPVATGATSITTNSFIANWNKVENAIIYQITIGTPNEDRSDIETILEIGTTTDLYYAKDKLEADTEYAYKIAAADKNGKVSDYSNLIIVKTDKMIHTITASVNNTDHGTITPLGEVKVTHGENQSFTIVPNDGYVIDRVMVDNVDVTDQLIENIYTFENVSDDHKIEASFTEVTGINEGQLSDFNIYYHAASDMVVLSHEALFIEVTNMNGQSIGKYSATSQVNLAHVPVGIYLFKVTLPEGIVIRKVMK